MLDRFLSWVFSSWIVLPILVVVLLGLSEFGWRVGLAHSRAKPKETKDGGSVPAAVLTLLGLLLGFTFAMAVSRHDTRRELVVQEANAISTTALRARLLPEPHATNAGRLLREYVALRIQVHRETQFSQRCAKAALTYMKASGMKRLPRPQNSRRPLPRVSLPASMRLLIWKRRALPPRVTMCLVPSGCCCCAWRVVVCG